MLLAILLSAAPLVAQEGEEQRGVENSYAEGQKERPSGFASHFTDLSYPNRACRYEFRIGIHANSDFFWDSPSEVRGYSAWNEYHSARRQEGNKYSWSTPHLGVALALNRHFALAVDGLATFRQQAVYDTVTGERIEHYKENSVWVSPSLRLNTLCGRHARLYCGLGIDFGFNRVGDKLEEMSASLAYKVGLTAGNRIFVYNEFSVSNVFLLASLGLGYRF